MSVSTLSRRVAVYYRDRFQCQYCGKSALKGDLSILDLSLDHFAPQDIGGDGETDNLITSCKLCNYLKSSNVFETLDDARRFIQSQRMLRERWFIENALVNAGYQPDRYNMMDLLFAIGGQEVMA